MAEWIDSRIENKAKQETKIIIEILNQLSCLSADATKRILLYCADFIKEPSNNIFKNKAEEHTKYLKEKGLIKED